MVPAAAKAQRQEVSTRGAFCKSRRSNLNPPGAVCAAYSDDGKASPESSVCFLLSQKGLFGATSPLRRNADVTAVSCFLVWYGSAWIGGKTR